MSPRARYAVVGTLMFVGIIVVAAPASLIRRAAPGDGSIEFVAPRGTLWTGQTDIVVAGVPVGQLDWTLRPLDLFSGMAGADWRLQSAGHDLQGYAARSLSGIEVTVSGSVQAQTVNRILAPYLIDISGDITLDGVRVSVDGPLAAPLDFTACEGRLHWEGGPVGYDLGGERQRVRLPALAAALELADRQPGATVIEAGGSTPLIIAQLLATGFVKVGITQRFTVLAGNPWPGSDPDHAVVLEVEEQLL